MIDLCYSNRTEPLLDALAENVKATQATLYDPVLLLVPNTFVADYVAQGLARRRGIAAHVKTGFLRAFLRDVAKASAPDLHIVDRDILEGALLALFHDDDRLAAPELAPVRGYLEPGDADRTALDRRRAQLAAQLAELLDEYSFSRPDMLTAWRKGRLVSGWNEPLQAWQRALWLSLFGPGGRLSGADSATLPEFFARTPPAGLRVPGPAHVFGISFVARLYRSIFAVAGARDAGLHLHAEPVPRAVGGPSTRAPRAAQATCGVAPAGAGARRRRGAGGFAPPPTRIRCSRSGDDRGATASGSTTTCPTAISANASRTPRPAWRRRRCSPPCSGRFWTARRAAANRHRTTTA